MKNPLLAGHGPAKLAFMDHADPARLRGRILRAYRKMAGVGTTELASRIGVSINVVSQWESGINVKRAARQQHIVDDVATALGLLQADRDAMQGLWTAAGTITALPARRRWSHNYPPGNPPAWVWLRRQPQYGPALNVHLWYSEALQAHLNLDDVPEGGLILQAPGCIPNPPLECTFDSPGWADFGTGTVRLEVASCLNVKVIEARALAAPSPRLDPPLHANDQRFLAKAFGMLRALADGFGVTWAILAPHIGIASPDHPPHPRPNNTYPPFPPMQRDAQGLVSQLRMTGQQIQALRTARGQSRSDAAASATRLGHDHLTAKNLEHLELEGRLPTAWLGIPRLDTVLGANGHLGIDRIYASTARGQRTNVPIPPFWQGPIWIEVLAAHPAGDRTTSDTPETAVVELDWPPWQCRQEIRAGDVLTTRCATTNSRPLWIGLPSGWKFAVGVGEVPGAIDINHGWHPVSLTAAYLLITNHVRMIVASRKGL